MPGTHDVSNIAKSVGELTLSKKSPAYFISQQIAISTALSLCDCDEYKKKPI